MIAENEGKKKAIRKSNLILFFIGVGMMVSGVISFILATAELIAMFSPFNLVAIVLFLIGLIINLWLGLTFLESDPS